MSSRSNRQVLRRNLRPRRTVPAPPHLAQLIHLVNEMPPEPEWRPLFVLCAGGDDLPAAKRQQLLSPRFAAVIDTYPPAIKRYFDPCADFEEIERRYTELE